MKKVIYICFLCAIVLFSGAKQTEAQSENTGWQLNIGGGFMNYYGDLSPYRIQKWSDWEQVFRFFQYNKYYTPEASFGIGLEKRFTPGLGVLFQADKGTFSMSDRYRKANGEYDRDAIHWERALNFKTEVYDAGLALVFHADNGKVLYANSFLAPYFFIGAGATYFKVKGDLYDADGRPYDYSDPDVFPDGKYETDLRPLMTETNKKYDNVVPYVDFGIGIKFRFSKVVSLTLQSDINYSFSDYLDDVSGKYKLIYASPEQAYAAQPGTNVSKAGRRGYDDGINDFYIFNKLSLQINLGKHLTHSRFRAPAVYNPGLFSLSESKDISQKHEDSIVQTLQKDSLEKAFKQDSAGKMDRTDSLFLLMKQMKTEMQSLRFTHIDQEYIIRQNETQHKIALLKHRRKAIQNKLHLSKEDSLQLRDYREEIDRLNVQKSAILRARRQLRKDMANTPVVTEYADSTKIMIYKGEKSHEADSLFLPEIETGPYFKDSAEQTELKKDTLHENTARSGERLRDTSRVREEQDSIIDRLNLVARRQYATNIARLKADSLQKKKLQSLVDSLQNEIQARRDQDSLSSTPKKSFFQKVFRKSSGNEKAKEAFRDTIAFQRSKIDENLKEIERLDKEMRNYRRNNEWYARRFSDLEGRNNLQQRYLREAIADLSRSQNRAGRISLQPSIAPVIVPGNSNNSNRKYERRLDEIRDRLDTLQVHNTQTRYKQVDTTDNNNEIYALRKKLDSLYRKSENEKSVDRDSLLSGLRKQVDDLNTKIEDIQKEYAAVAKEEAAEAISNFPVISTYFATGASQLTPEQIKKLRPAASMLKKNENATILLRGFTDATGSARVNKAIAEKRCLAVKKALMENYNIASSRINIGEVELSKGRGSNPMQRRVDLKLN